MVNEAFRGLLLYSESFPDEIISQTEADLSVSGREKKKKAGGGTDLPLLIWAEVHSPITVHSAGLNDVKFRA